MIDAHPTAGLRARGIGFGHATSGAQMEVGRARSAIRRTMCQLPTATRCGGNASHNRNGSFQGKHGRGGIQPRSNSSHRVRKVGNTH